MKDLINSITIIILLITIIFLTIFAGMVLSKHEKYIEVLTDANIEMLDSIKQQREQINDLEFRIERLEKEDES
jgi:cell division protein FtsL